MDAIVTAAAMYTGLAASAISSAAVSGAAEWLMGGGPILAAGAFGTTYLAYNVSGGNILITSVAYPVVFFSVGYFLLRNVDK